MEAILAQEGHAAAAVIQAGLQGRIVRQGLAYTPISWYCSLGWNEGGT